MKKTLILLVAGGWLLSLPSWGGPVAADDTARRTVQVDVVVTKDGAPVKDLAKTDFSLVEDEQSVAINSFSLVESRPGESGSPARRLVVIYHDTSVWDMNLKPQVAEIADELAKLAGQGIEIMVVKMNWTEDLKIVQSFTAQENLVRAAADMATRIVGGDQIHDALWVDKPDFFSSAQGSRLIRDAEKGSRAAYRTVGRQRFEKALGGLLTVCNMIQNTPGRKSILFISNGIPDLSSSSSSTVLEGDKSGREILDAIHVRDQEGYTNVRIFDPFGIMKDRNFSSAEDVIRELVWFANSNGISIYALDPGVFARASKTGTSEYQATAEEAGRTFVEEEKSNQLQNLRLIAERTGALLFRGSGKIAAMDEALTSDLSSYYQLSFVPARKKADGAPHTLAVKINRKGADVRSRSGYRDESPEDAALNRLVSAYYTPDLYTQVRFAGEFLPFSVGKGKNQPWMSIALPTREIFPPDVPEGPLTLDMHVWLKKAGEKAYGGTLSLPFTVDAAFLENARKRSFLWYFFSGPELELEPGAYQVVYALVHRESGKIGTWHSTFVVPERGVDPAFLNCVLGAVAQNSEKQREEFALNRETGHMEYGGLRFLPQVTNRFSGRQTELYVFCQVFDPSGTGAVRPEFRVTDLSGAKAALPGEVIAESWNKKSKIWSGLFKLDFSAVTSDEHAFQAVIAGPEGKSVLGPEIRFVKLGQ